MSRLYEALRRAKEERRNAGSAADVSISGQDGDSCLAAIESVPPEAPSSATLSTAEDISQELPHQLTTSDTFEPPDLVQSPNGFRHLTLPLREESRLAFHTHPHGLAAEQFRLLRRTLNEEFATGGVLMITSPGVGDGKTLTSLNLCTCLADSGDPTLLAEVDVRWPTARKILGCAIQPPGIEDALAGKVEPGEAIHWIKELSLYAAMVAKVPNHPSHLVNGVGLQQFLAWARAHFRWVVLDSAPVLPAADVAELLPFADAVLLVIRAQRSPRELSKRAIEMLGKRLHGVIFNEATIDSNPYYRYLSHYYQGSGTKADRSGPK